MARLSCAHKLRFGRLHDAERLAAHLRTIDPTRQKQLNIYWCVSHAAWHVGHHRGLLQRKADWNIVLSLALLERLRLELIVQYGQTLDRESWTGVRFLTGAIRYLRAQPHSGLTNR